MFVEVNAGRKVLFERVGNARLGGKPDWNVPGVSKYVLLGNNKSIYYPPVFRRGETGHDRSLAAGKVQSRSSGPSGKKLSLDRSAEQRPPRVYLVGIGFEEKQTKQKK